MEDPFPLRALPAQDWQCDLIQLRNDKPQLFKKVFQCEEQANLEYNQNLAKSSTDNLLQFQIESISQNSIYSQEFVADQCQLYS